MTQPLPRGDWLVMVVVIVAFTVALAGSAFVLLPDHWYVWGVVVIVAVVALVWWHTHRFTYRCPNCGHEFDISIVTNLTRPHGVGRGGAWKSLRCPACGDRVKAELRRSDSETDCDDAEA